jgi:hypothetical protein
MLLETRISLVLLFASLTPPFAAAEDTVLWRVGLRDDSSSEFTGQAFPALYPIPTDWAQRSQWPEFAPQVTGQPDRHAASDKLDTTFQYSLPTVPAHGAVFRFKTLNASSFVTEVAVFANGLPCGILQMVGTEGWLGEEQKGRRFGNTHAAYIPPEFFRTGNNTLRIEKLGHPYCRENFNYCSVTLDCLELVALSRPATEPLHSRLVHIGSQLGEFHYNDPREYINTEMGTHRRVHIDFMNLGVNHALNASMHDRIFRAHIGFCDVFLNFATFPFGDVEFRTIEGDQYQPETWVAAEFEPKEEFRQHAQDSRVKVFRRLALAYATHGKPLPYVYPDERQVQNQLVYFRGVDTSTLPPLPGSGGKSKKVLLNFVNFSQVERTMTVRVTLPLVGIYAGVRFGPDDQYLAARSLSQLQATPEVPLTETLGPGEAIQYVLEKDERLTQLAACPAAPTNLRATGGKIGKLGYAKLAWDCGPADEIKIQRSADGIRFLQIDAIPAAQHAYEDASRTGPEPGRAYWYRVKAATARGESASSDIIRVEIPR